MSLPRVPNAKDIPVGILVSAPGGASKPKRPVPARCRKHSRVMAWTWVAIGGATAALLMVIAGIAAAMRPQHVPSAEVHATRLVQKSTPSTNCNPSQDLPSELPLEPERETPSIVKALPYRAALRPQDDLFEVDIAPVAASSGLAEAKPVIEPARAAVEPPVQPKKNVNLALFQDCQQIGTNVLFMRNPPDAFKKAKEEKKMVFIVNLSGNLEDKDFT